MSDLLDGAGPFDPVLRASLVDLAFGPWLDALGRLYGIERPRAAVSRAPRTALHLLGPWAPPRTALNSDAAADFAARRSAFGMAAATGEWILFLPTRASGCGVES